MAKPAKLPSIRLSAIPSVVQRVHERPATPSSHQQFNLRRRHVPYHPTEDVRTGGDYTRQRTKRAGKVLWREPPASKSRKDPANGIPPKEPPSRPQIECHLEWNEEFIIIGTKQQRHKLSNHFPVKLLDNDICPSDSVRNLGVVFDSDFSFHKHVSNICKSCFHHIRDLRRIRRHIPLSTAKTMSNALISSRLDYCISLLNNIAKQDLSKLQRVQNCLARVVLRAPRFSRSLPLLKQLHWLPVNYRIKFRMSTLTYRALAIHQPPYLASLLHFSNIPRQLRSSTSHSFLFPELNWTWASVLSLLLHPSFGMNSQPHWNIVKVFPLSVNISKLISSKLLFHLE